MTENELFGNSELMDDTISRRGTVKAIRDAMLAWSSMPQWREDKIVDAVKALPSAQPEIIRCKDCKHWTNNIGDSKLRDNYCNDEAHGFYYQCSEDDYCSFAERRTDG